MPLRVRPTDRAAAWRHARWHAYVVLGDLDGAVLVDEERRRITPLTTLPYAIFFAECTPPVRTSSRVAGQRVSARHVQRTGELGRFVGEMPITAIPASFSSARLSRKSHACFVQPGVIAAGRSR